MKFCSQCGQPVQEGQKFCSKCGNKLMPVQVNQGVTISNPVVFQQEEPKINEIGLVKPIPEVEESKEVSQQQTEVTAAKEEFLQKESVSNEVQQQGADALSATEELIQTEPLQAPVSEQVPYSASSYTFNETAQSTNNFTAQPQSNFSNYNNNMNNNNMNNNNMNNNNMNNNNMNSYNMNNNNMNNNNIGNTQVMPNFSQYNYQQNGVGYNGPTAQVKVARAPRKKMSIAAKIIIAFIILLLLGAGGFYGYGSYVTSKQYVADKIEKAIDGNDANQLLQYIKSSDNELKIDESGAKAVLNLINSSTSYKTKLIESLEKGKSYECFSMVENGKKLLLFKNYVMEIEPQFISISANYENVDIKLDGKSVGKTLKDGKTNKFGPFAPGIYKLELIMTNEFGTSAVKETVELKEGGFSYYGDFQLKTAYTYLEIDKMKLSVEGKVLDREFPIGDNEIGPFPAESAAKLTFFKEYPWGKLQSIEYTVDEVYNGEYVTDFQMRNSDYTKSAAPTMKAFMQSYYAAKSTLDAEKLVDASENCKNEFKNGLYFATPANFALDKAYLNMYGLYARTESSGRDMFRVYAAADYKYEGYDYKENFTLDMYFDEAQGKWIIDNFTTYGSTDGEYEEIQ